MMQSPAKRIPLLLALAALAACGGQNSSNTTSTMSPQETPAATPESTMQAPPSATPAATATAAPTAAPTPAETPAATDTPPATPAPTPAAEASATSPTASVAWPATAPDTFKVRFEFSNGTVVAEFHKDWAPIGVEHIYELLKMGYYNEARFFRVVPNFIVQVGINADPTLSAIWSDKNIQDEPVRHPNTPGTITFAKTSMPNTRSTQLFINLGDNTGPPAYLDRQGFAPLGEIIEGMDVVQKINGEYGEQPDQGAIQSQGNVYLKQNFPNMDYIKSATLVQ